MPHVSLREVLLNLIFRSQPANPDKNSAIYEPGANCRTTDTFELKVRESDSCFILAICPLLRQKFSLKIIVVGLSFDLQEDAAGVKPGVGDRG